MLREKKNYSLCCFCSTLSWNSLLMLNFQANSIPYFYLAPRTM